LCFGKTGKEGHRLQVWRFCQSKSLKVGRISRKSGGNKGGGGRVPGDYRARLRSAKKTGCIRRTKGAAEVHETAALSIEVQVYLLHTRVREIAYRAGKEASQTNIEVSNEGIE
jgi:hypothetical protein